MLNSQNSQNYLAPAAFIGGILTATAANNAANALYAWWNSLPVFNKKTKQRHLKLQEIYRKMGRSTNLSLNIPEFWKLDEASRPSFKMDLDIIIADISEKVNEYQSVSTRTALFISALLEKFSSFLDSIQKHNWVMDGLTNSGMSSSGVEAMFLGEMISWVTSSFCIFALESDQELKIFKARIEYCRDIINTIPIANHRNKFRPSFKSFLEDLVYSMDNYYNFCQSQRDARELNDYIKEAEAKISILTSKIIKTVMTLNIHSDYKKDNFDLLMSPPITNYPKINAMRNSGLGNWLYSIMYQMRVLNTAYNIECMLTVEEINQMLKNQHPYDTAFFYRDTNLRNCNHPAWGHRSFVLKQEDSLHKAENYNLVIREMIRGIAWLFFIQKTFKGLKIMSSGNGLVWIYGSSIGKAVLSETIENIKWILNEKVRVPLDLLSKGYIKDGLSYCRKNNTDYAEDMDFSLLTYLQTRLNNDLGILGSGGDLAQLRVILKNVITTANNSLDMKEKLRQEQAVLISDQLDTFKLRDNKYYENTNFIILNQALKKCQKADRDKFSVHMNSVKNTETLIIVDYYKFNYSYEQLPHYNEAVRLLEAVNDSIPKVEAVNHDLFNNKYGHHASLTNIYMRFIQFYVEDISTRYELLFDTDPVYAFFIPQSWIAANALNLPREKLPDLRKLWFSVNNVFQYLMSLSAIPEVIELELIVYVIKEKLVAFYLKNHEIPAILLGFEMMWKVNRHQNGVEVCLNNYALSVTNSAVQLLIHGYIEKIKTLEQQLEKKEQELNKTKGELEIRKTILDKKEAIINRNFETIKQITEKMHVNTNTISENEAIQRLTIENETLREEISRLKLNAVIQTEHDTYNREEEKEAEIADAPLIGTPTAAASVEGVDNKSNKRIGFFTSINTTVRSIIKHGKASEKLSTTESKEQDVKNTSTRYRVIDMTRFSR